MATKRYSDFWLDGFNIDWDFSDDSDTVDISNSKTEKTAHLIRLSAARRAIANYVSILTNKTIPVMFNDASVSLTDGKVVYIGADVNDKNNFDVAVGLALHEGSHICYSNFDMFKTIWQRVPREIYDYTEKLGINKEKVADICRTILNIVEDRYIDYVIYKNAPGYRGYYQALYDKYFYTSAIDDGLKSKLYRASSVESYIFRLINITNKNTDLNALPGLYDMAKCLSLSNINRLDTPTKRLETSLEISTIMFKNITEKDGYNLNQIDVINSDDTKNPESNNEKNGSETSNSNDSESNDKSNKTGGSELDDIFGGSQTKVDDVISDTSINDIGSDAQISKSKLQKIMKSFDKQKDFLAGNIKKKRVTKKENQILTVLEKSKIDLIDVGSEYLKSQNIIGALECILVKNMTRELVLNDEFPLYSQHGFWNNVRESTIVKELQKFVDEGISLGIKIGKRLQFRNEINIDKFSRREIGKIDKRILHELGCESENIFYTIATSKYKKMNFHISVDASSSMRGEKWNKTIRLCTAIAKAASMLDNIRVTISFRTTMGKSPYVVIGYDSSLDKIVKIKSLFSLLQPSGLTPEGLSFEAIMKVIPKSYEDTESYFINISDGEPCFSFTNCDDITNINYSGEDAARHTRTQINKFRDNNYRILSYFVSESNCLETINNKLFKIMYGDDAVYINVGNLNQIINTINKKLLESIDN